MGGSKGTVNVPTSASNQSAKCGNAAEDDGEQCDDGNAVGGDGCNALCRVEGGWECPKTGACHPASVCGDGFLGSTEECDDKNTTAGDGCAADCKKVEDGWRCHVPGKACVPDCGDSKITATENCDDGNDESDDGCSSTCVIEPGWYCEEPGKPCVEAECGNKIKEPGETCDLGDDNGLFFGDGTGCSKSCTAEPKCRDDAGKALESCKTSCGDANIDPDEKCDDGNQNDGDGCSHECEVEDGFACKDSDGTDLSKCDGSDCLVLPITFRDFDSQKESSGHPDFFFYGATVGGKKTVCVPNASGRPVALGTACPSSDSTALCQGLVQESLDKNGKPAANTGRTGGLSCDCRFTDWDAPRSIVTSSTTDATSCTVTGDGSTRYRIATKVQVIQSADSFKDWYNDTGKGKKVVSKIQLKSQGSNLFQFSGDTRTVYDDLHDIFLGTMSKLQAGWFPLDDQTGAGAAKICNLWAYWSADAANCVAKEGNTELTSQWDPRGWYGDAKSPPAKKDQTGGPVAPVTGVKHNFYFTSEVRYFFRYVGGEKLQFFGDDDVYVFINNKLVLDLGAPHERLQGSVTLSDTGAAWTIQGQDVTTGEMVAVSDGKVTGKFEKGKTYEIAVFHADRHPRESNYQLTLSGFSTKKSGCASTCGDGTKTPNEECDEGDANEDGKYGGCTTKCQFGPFCGDESVDGDEECDRGKNNGAAYGEDGCTMGCRKAHRCGDGIIDTDYKEQCDDGEFNGKGACDEKCKYNQIQN